MDTLTIEEFFKEFAGFIALGVELLAVIVIAIGAIEAIVGVVKQRGNPLRPFAGKKEVFIRFGSWLLLGLEFALAADIVRSAISPTWTQIGQLAAIAGIRTFLNYFLERDVEKFTEQRSEVEAIHTPSDTVEARV
ncbi:MAG: DUF1622 domain-containing protein [Acidobacteria bacterium]|nr:DUF1622 domain-containing protein [Acidobacteriota bacterium]